MKTRVESIADLIGKDLSNLGWKFEQRIHIYETTLAGGRKQDCGYYSCEELADALIAHGKTKGLSIKKEVVIVLSNEKQAFLVTSGGAFDLEDEGEKRFQLKEILTSEIDPAILRIIMN